MKKTALKLLMVFPGAMLVCQGPVWAKDSDMGQMEFQSACASCHGTDGKGNGPIASQLKTAPSDLTQLAKKNGGVFPVSAVYEAIDGRQEIKAHGPRDMPVWGYLYVPPLSKLKPIECWPGLGGLSDPEPFIRTRILGLVDYLSRIQQK